MKSLTLIENIFSFVHDPNHRMVAGSMATCRTSRHMAAMALSVSRISSQRHFDVMEKCANVDADQ